MIVHRPPVRYAEETPRDVAPVKILMENGIRLAEPKYVVPEAQLVSWYARRPKGNIRLVPEVQP